jgi:hypothetical protein
MMLVLYYLILTLLGDVLAVILSLWFDAVEIVLMIIAES